MAYQTSFNKKLDYNTPVIDFTDHEYMSFIFFAAKECSISQHLVSDDRDFYSHQ
ncbi:MAG: hypothetical protein PHR24_01845 [Oscillospiraceae bacterium]|nr:hypothetical protein [Oscillospiraceae bacterium]MDD4546022.1 hypothetical protein [Oscillospiraceae bacterium]